MCWLPEDTAIEELSPEEEVARRVPKVWVRSGGVVLREAFDPTPKDRIGLSFVRLCKITKENAARSPTQPNKKYYLAVFKYSDLVKYSFTLDPKPTPMNPGHAVMPELKSTTPRPEVLELTEQLLNIPYCVCGPY